MLARPQYPHAIAYLDPHASFNGRKQLFLAKIERVADRTVDGYEIDGREGDAGLLEGFLRGGADGEEGVVRSEGGEAVVLRGVGEVERAAGEQAEFLGSGEGEGGGDRGGL